MKRLVLSVLIVMVSAMSAVAGIDNINYQAIIKTANGIVANKEVEMKFELLDNDGNVIYSEVQTPVTSASGFVNCQLGERGDLSAVDWSDLMLRVSLNLGDGYAVILTETVSSVPSSLYSLRSADTEELRKEYRKELEKASESLEASFNDWVGKTLATYGDSVTAINNGDFSYPYSSDPSSYRWGNFVAAYFKFRNQYGRGAGGQKFGWYENGGAVVFVDSATGKYVGRDDSRTLDNYTGEIPANCVATRGSGCSWDRICKMFPDPIKDTIDVVTVMFHNDAGHPTREDALEWVAGNTVDKEWAASEFYGEYKGDFNINTIRGGIASTVMKLQCRLPNAVIVLCTPISGRGTTGELDPTLSQTRYMEQLASIVKDVGFKLSVPVIDVYGTDGINGLNRTRYITDGIHPYCVEGGKTIARSIIGGLKTILPKDF